MAEQVYNIRSGFYNAINKDRTYSADDMNKPYKRIVSDGVFCNPNGTPSEDFQVIATTGMVLNVKPGNGLVAHKWIESETITPIVVPGNTSLNSRVDGVFLQVDESTRTGNIVYKTGDITPASGKTEYLIATVTVASGATSITQADIVDKRGDTCPWVAALIEQPDMSTLWANFTAAYQQSYDAFIAQQQAGAEAIQQAWDDFFSQLTDELTMTMNIETLKNTYTTTADETTIPIGIPSYSSGTDVLMVFINGLMADSSMYSVSGSNVVLVNALPENNKVDFVVFKSLVTADQASTVSAIQQLTYQLDAATGDSGWSNVTLLNGAGPGRACRVRKVGKTVTISGDVVLADETKPFAQIPYAPAYDYYVTVLWGTNLAMIKIDTTGVLSLSRWIGSPDLNFSLPIDSTFLD